MLPEQSNEKHSTFPPYFISFCWFNKEIRFYSASEIKFLLGYKINKEGGRILFDERMLLA